MNINLNINIHPAFVHFPIALLTVYAVLELVRFKKVIGLLSWTYIKFAFLLLGTLGAYSAILTGEVSRSMLLQNSLDPTLRNIVHTHESFAKVTAVTFSALLGAYVLALFAQSGFLIKLPEGYVKNVVQKLCSIAEWIFKSPLMPLAALVGLAAVTITGALGASMVYGPNNDPIVHIVYQVLIAR